MDALGSLPDFGAPFGNGAVLGFAPYGDGPCVVLPAGVALAVAKGQPVFALNMVRRADPNDPTGNYAALEIQLADDIPLDDALTQARAIRPYATVVPATIDLGFARLVPAGASVALPAGMTTPAPFGSSAGGGPRWAQRLDLATGELIKGGLLGRTLLFSAKLEFTVWGVAARTAARAGFVPADLLNALLADRPDRSIAAEDLLTRLTPAPRGLSIAGSVSPDRLAQIMADRLCAAYGRFIAAPGPLDPPHFSFASAAPTDPVNWDLNTPVAVPRVFALQADLLNALKAVKDPAALVHEIAVPPLDLGFREIVVTADLPPNRTGVPAIGARIAMPPAPPVRPDAVNKTATLALPSDQARVPLQIGPDEPLAYTVTTFALVVAGGAVHQLQGASKAGTGEWLRVTTDDWPVSFAHLTASDRLLQLATLSGALSYTLDGKPVTQPIVLKPGASDIAVPVPAAAKDASIALTASAADGAKAQIGPLQPGLIRLDLPSFPGYGPHRIDIGCTFAGNEPPLVIELETEDGLRQGSAALLPQSPTSIWGYVASSPFHAGFRYRPQGGAWSAILQGVPSLMFKPDGTVLETNDDGQSHMGAVGST